MVLGGVKIGGFRSFHVLVTTSAQCIVMHTFVIKSHTPRFSPIEVLISWH